MREEIINLAKMLMAKESTKENEGELEGVLKVVTKKLNSKYRVSRFTKNGSPSLLFYNTESLPKKFKVILNAHLDVVPGKMPQFKPYVKGDKLFGRGSQDMKGPAAVEILIFQELADKLNYPIGLQLVTDEETGGFNGSKYQLSKGVKTEFILAGEPTDFKINNEAKGIIWGKIKVKGVSAHGAYPWKGKNALVQLNECIKCLLIEFPIPTKDSWQTTVNISRVETTNNTFNKVPDEATAFFDMRYIPSEATTILKRLSRCLPKYCKLEIVLKEPSQFTEKTNDYISKLKNSCRKIYKKEAQMLATHGGSDVRYYNSAGCAGITFGPTGDGMHTDKEWVSIKSLETYYYILKDWLLTLQ